MRGRGARIGTVTDIIHTDTTLASTVEISWPRAPDDTQTSTGLLA